jgi:hypothetical protein
VTKTDTFWPFAIPVVQATLAQLYFLDYYFDLLGYLHARKGRTAGFKNDVAARGVSLHSPLPISLAVRSKEKVERS